MSSGLGGDGAALRRLEAQARCAFGLAEFDELVRLRFREQRPGFVAEVFDGLEGDRGDEKTAENRACEFLDFHDRFAVAFDFRLQRRRGEIDAGDAAVVTFGCPAQAAAVGRDEFVFAFAGRFDELRFDFLEPRQLTNGP